MWFESVIRDHLDVGRPHQIALVFNRLVTRSTPGTFRTRVLTKGVDPTLCCYYKSSRLKQYFKEGKALRTETVICDTKDFGIGRRVCSENWSALKKVGESANRQLGKWSDLLGQSQARTYYERVAREYSDQPVAVAEARKWLVENGPSEFEIVTPYTSDRFSFALSPDGRRVVFVATVNGTTALWLREIDSSKQAPIPGTASNRYQPTPHGPNPFWSPDGRFVAYFEDRKLKRICMNCLSGQAPWSWTWPTRPMQRSLNSESPEPFSPQAFRMGRRLLQLQTANALSSTNPAVRIRSRYFGV
jgi:hypothetical protein